MHYKNPRVYAILLFPERRFGDSLHLSRNCRNQGCSYGGPIVPPLDRAGRLACQGTRLARVHYPMYWKRQSSSLVNWELGKSRCWCILSNEASESAELETEKTPKISCVQVEVQKLCRLSLFLIHFVQNCPVKTWRKTCVGLNRRGSMV